MVEEDKDPVTDPETDPPDDPPTPLPKGQGKGEGEGEDPPDTASLEVKRLQKEFVDQQKLLKQSQEELKKFKDGFKSLFGEEKKKEKPDPNSELKQYMEEQFKQINSRLDEKEHEEVMSNLSENIGLKTPEQKEFFEFKIMKAQEEKGEALSQKEIQSIGEGVKKLHGEEKAKTGSSVNATDGGPAVNIGDSESISYKTFKDMDLMERSELFRANPKMFEKYTEKENAGIMKVT